MKATSVFPSFALRNEAGKAFSHPAGRPAAFCFVKEDCPTCNIAMPAVEALYRALRGSGFDVLVIGQTAEGNRILCERHELTVPVLDDSMLAVSFAGRVEIVPTVVLCDEEGREVRRLEGFVREQWRALWDEIAARAGAAAPELDWNHFPAHRPGCGSLSSDPTVSERLRAEAEDSPLRARKLEIGAGDEFEFMFEQGFSDGLPLVPPTQQRVLRMLAGTHRRPQDLVATVPPHMGRGTVEKVAINAVMAGCAPECLPVVIAALEAVCTDVFNIHGVMATTMGASPVMVVNGPIRRRIGMEMGLGALGQGNRANATIGRALRLTLRNIGGARPGGVERPTLSNPMKFTMCFAEWEERSPWRPLHVERGFEPTDSVVTVFAMTSGPTLVVDQTSRKAAQLAGSIGLAAIGALHPRAYGVTNVLLVISPEHVQTLERDGYSKQDLRKRIQEVSLIPRRRLVMDEVSGVGLDPEKARQLPPELLDQQVAKFSSESDIDVVVAGGEAGKFSGIFHGWTTGARGSVPVSRKIEEA